MLFRPDFNPILFMLLKLNCSQNNSKSMFLAAIQIIYLLLSCSQKHKDKFDVTKVYADSLRKKEA